MMDYRQQFKSCGSNVVVEHNVYIEHPEALEVGDNVRFMSGFYMLGAPGVCQFGNNVCFMPNIFIEGSPARFLVGNDVTFFPGAYIASGLGDSAFTEIGHSSHFAPHCVLYGQGGLSIGNHNNVAAQTVFATVQHDDNVLDRPMSQTAISGPITLEDDVWIAANVTITMNTRIATGCVIGANSVVTRDTQPMGVYVGAPARRLRDRGQRAPR